MQLQPIIAIEGVSISYDFYNQWLYIDWQGEHNQATYQMACRLILEALRTCPCRKILNDSSGITRTAGMPAQWRAWWLKEMRRVGLHHVAWVLPADFAARQTTEMALQAIQRPVVGTFDDVASAYGWLQRQSRPVLSGTRLAAPRPAMS